ncbi:Outer membrane protein TolC [Ohtaekwangia koreensis]|uniref:Outer membrane protein TolC n=2 Tax=Ohtaekwangia koreensis TaxID=688867 RepID=A0A1T5MD00_9BACT|nr:Outer membrane protein TolC [Ohtaekwangia koreensis]
MKMAKYRVLSILMWSLLTIQVYGQNSSDTIPGTFTLEQCIAYALQNTPSVRQAQLDESIAERDVRIGLSSWLPQISAQYAAAHNIRRQSTVFGDQVITVGTKYTSNILMQANQTLYSNDVLLASRAAKYSRLQAEQNTTSFKIEAVVETSKAFYDILFTKEQLRILDENIVRQEKQYKDAFNRYQAGLTDKTDYQRASISLANTKSSKKRTLESTHAKLAYIKQLMGLPPEKDVTLSYDSATLMNEGLLIDTTQTPSYVSRVEYKQLQTQMQLLHLNTNYYKIGFLPTLSAYINYNPLFFNNSLSELYNKAYPTSAVGVQATIPIFTGTKRIQNVKRAQLREERLQVQMEDTQRAIYTEYQTALANYKSDYNEWQVLRQNAVIAEEVYNTIKLQYDEGIKAYVDLIVAETDLQTAQLNYYNALFQVLSSKLDYEKALGIINVN